MRFPKTLYLKYNTELADDDPFLEATPDATTFAVFDEKVKVAVYELKGYKTVNTNVEVVES